MNQHHDPVHDKSYSDEGMEDGVDPSVNQDKAGEKTKNGRAWDGIPRRRL